jgi:hypothetical protein
MATTYTETPKDDTITHVEHSTPTVGQNIAKADAAAKFLANAHVDDVSFSYEEEHALLKRVDYRVLPLLL